MQGNSEKMNTDMKIDNLMRENEKLLGLVETYKADLEKCRHELAESVREEIELKYSLSEMSMQLRMLSKKLQLFENQEEKN